LLSARWGQSAQTNAGSTPYHLITHGLLIHTALSISHHHCPSQQIHSSTKEQFNSSKETATMGRGAAGHSPEYEKKRAAIGGVISFNDANGIKYGKRKLFEHFGIHFTTGYHWFPPSAAKPPGGPSKAGNIKTKDESQGLKRTRPEDPDDEISALKAEPDEPPASPRQNPIRNGGRDRKRLKAIVEDLAEGASPPMTPPLTADASSPPPPRQLLTPPKGKRGQPKRSLKAQPRQQARRMESVMDLKYESVDDDIFGAI
jgi:hypothetical protein